MLKRKAKSVVTKKSFLTILSLFIIFEIIIIAMNYNAIFPGNTGAYPAANGKWPAGDILFTGDTFGAIDLYGCEQLGSISRRANVLKKFNDYLYLDFGNITRNSPRVNKTAFPLLLEGLQYMKLDVLNLTKRDFINLSEINYEVHGIHLVSANLQIQAPANQGKLVLPYKLLPLQLRSKKETRQITVGITGISNNLRKLHRGIANYTMADINPSLKKIMGDLEKADLRILLFNDTWFKLDKLLTGPGIRFHLVIASSTLPGQVNRMIYLHNTPVVFADEYGRSLGHVRVVKKKHGFKFEYNAYNLGMGMPEDKQIKKITGRIIKRMQKETGLKIKSIPAEKENER
jgi:2',3'-cyclic-nucleotide 2'-phosphodiesterase (5'-nucleotidase family)